MARLVRTTGWKKSVALELLRTEAPEQKELSFAVLGNK